MANELVSEIYLIKQFEKNFATKLRPIMYDLGAWRALDGDVSDPTWRDDLHFWYVSPERDHHKRNEAAFLEHRYDPQLSEVVYGKAAVIEEDTVKVDGFAVPFDNRGSSVDTRGHISETVTLSRSVEHTFSQKYSFSMESETQVSGSYGGVEFQQTLKATFGTEFDVSDTEHESKSVEQQITQDLRVPAGKKIIVSFEKNKMITETPFTVNGYLDFKLWLNFEDWASEDLRQGKLLFQNWHKGDKKFEFGSLLAFERFLKGYDVKYPQMASYPTHASGDAKKAMDWIFDKENRKIEATGTKRREFDNNVNVVTQEA